MKHAYPDRSITDYATPHTIKPQQARHRAFIPGDYVSTHRGVFYIDNEDSVAYGYANAMPDAQLVFSALDSGLAYES